VTGDIKIFYNDLLKQIGVGINIARAYPKGHPSMQPIVQRLRILLKEIPIEKDSISMVVIEDVIMIDDERYSSKQLPIIKSLVNRFNKVGVKSITFGVDLSENDIREFFNAMVATPADLADYGDIVALVRAKGIIGIQVNKLQVGVVSSDQEGPMMAWGQFLDTLAVGRTVATDEERIRELGGFLAQVGLVGSEPINVQTDRIISGLERLALLVADQYGEDRWDEYSMVFSRMLSALSPNIKKNIVKYRTENKKLAVLFKNLIPTMTDEDIIDVITTKAGEKGPAIEQDIIDILKNVTGTRLPGILASLRVNAPQLDFEKIVARLMTEIKSVEGERGSDAFASKNLETQMRTLFPRLRDDSQDVRRQTVEELSAFTERIFDSGNTDLLRLLIDRFDSMADAETDMATFEKVIDSLRHIYATARKYNKNDIVQFISKKFSKHLLRKDVALLDKKKCIIRAISDLKDENYVTELVSLLWDQGTFVEAREALTLLSEFSTPLLIETLKDTDDKSIRMKILDVLVRIGKNAIPEIRKLLASSKWYIRRNGVHLLGEIRASEAVDILGERVLDESEQVQLEVIDSLKKIGDHSAKKYFIRALASKYKSTIIAAVQNLSKEESAAKLSEIAGWLKARKGIPEKEEETFRQKVITVLGQHGDNSVISALVDVLHEKALFRGNLLYPTKEAALKAIHQIGGEEAAHALEQAAAGRDQQISVYAQELLSEKENTT
jgi:hypothetical protein